MSNQKFPPDLRLLNPVSALTGARDALAAINTTNLPDGAVVMVTDADTLYRLEKGSTVAASSPEIIAPAEGGPGRWFRYGEGASFFQSVTVTHATIPPNSGITSDGVTVTGYTNTNDVLSYNLQSSGLNSSLVVGLPRNTSSDRAEWTLYNVSGTTIDAGSFDLRVTVHDSP